LADNAVVALPAAVVYRVNSCTTVTIPEIIMRRRKEPARSNLPGGVIVPGLVSLCMNLSSEMIHRLLPLFLVTVLGASALSVGLNEGVAEATAAAVAVAAKIYPPIETAPGGIVCT